MSSKNEINNEFKNAINLVVDSLKYIGIDIDSDNYDGILVKKLRPTNVIYKGDSTSSNQSHIAITGKQMEMFPYLRSDEYFNKDSSDDTLKQYFTLKAPIDLDKKNISYLKNNEISEDDENDKINSFITILRSKRSNQPDQIQVSIKKHDDEIFIKFRELLGVDYYLILLKIKEEFKYEAYGIKPDDGDSLSVLNNKFYHLVTETLISTEDIDDKHYKNVEQGQNILLYGVPGSGKSWTIQRDYCSDESHMERVVFHPDYTYSDFIGQILPKVENGDVFYEFTPGPFTLILKEAEEKPKEQFYLIIEEINRGNAPAIFGDVFQLLDRKHEYKENNDDWYPIGTSEYGITNSDIAKEVYGDENRKVRIPSNLSIIGTMNTSDQNVFTLDTAFQRRWDMKMIENSFDNVDDDFKMTYISETTVSWENFCTRINEIILEKNIFNTSSEDKRLGVYFVTSTDLKDCEKFSEKVLKYLWDDAFKLSREDIFDVSQYNSLESVIKTFNSSNNNDKFNVFKQGVRDKLLMDSDNGNSLGEQ